MNEDNFKKEEKEEPDKHITMTKKNNDNNFLMNSTVYSALSPSSKLLNIDSSWLFKKNQTNV